MIEVFHWAEKPGNPTDVIFGFMLDMDEAKDVWQGKNASLGYTKVADVYTDDLEKAFELTNHIDSDWTKGIRVIAVEGQRSTSTGDVMKMADGSLHLVAAFGFVKLEI